jgi:DNA-binding LytR/AlgR family response regulator
MTTLQVLIVDDEPLARGIIESYVEKVPELKLVASCKNALEAFSILSKHSVDLVLLDINMPEINGIELLKTLKNPPMVIFTTAYPEFAVASYDLNAIDYLLKPVPFERFLKAIDKLSATLQNNKQNGANVVVQPINKEDDILFVKSEGKLVKIDLDKLIFVEGLKDYLKLWMETGKLVVHSTMKNMEEQLAKRPNFVRVNKSYIINMKYVNEVDGNSIRLKDQLITIGNTYRDEVQKLFNKYKLL